MCQESLNRVSRLNSEGTRACERMSGDACGADARHGMSVRQFGQLFGALVLIRAADEDREDRGDAAGHPVVGPIMHRLHE